MLPSQPDGSISWALDGPSGSVAVGTVVPDVGAVSATIEIDAAYNTLSIGAFQTYRDLSWSFDIDGITHSGSVRYNIEIAVPFGASPDGVRTKLGVAGVEVPDSEISMLSAYL